LTKINALSIAIIVHVAGCIGILSPWNDWFIKFTPYNLLLMFALVIYTSQQRDKSFWIFLPVSGLVGFTTEVIGVNTALLFGSYSYTGTLGFSIFNVPVIIGVNWFLIVYCSGVVMDKVHRSIEAKVDMPTGFSSHVQVASFVIDGALLATFFDFVMEPVAIKLGYWQWNNNSEPPFTNYVTWFIISSLLLLFMRTLRVNTANHFAVHLLIIQILFFSFLRSFL
jgi:putative membrane protein